MKLLPKRINDMPRRYLVGIAAVVGLIVILAIILFVQMKAPKPAAPFSGPSEGELFGTALKQMETAKAQGTPMDASNPLILTAKAVVSTPSAQTPISNGDAQLTVTAMLALATQQASTPKP